MRVFKLMTSGESGFLLLFFHCPGACQRLDVYITTIYIKTGVPEKQKTYFPMLLSLETIFAVDLSNF